MDHDETTGRALAAAAAAGAGKAQVSLVRSETTQLDVGAGGSVLLRTTTDVRLALGVVVDGRRGGATISATGEPDLGEAAARAVAAAHSAGEDPANDIAPAAPPATFERGPREPDRAVMCDSLDEVLAHIRGRYPLIRLEQCILEFTTARSFFANSNGVSFQAATGLYGFVAIYTAKEGRRTSSMNYSDARRLSLAEPLATWGSVEERLRQTSGQLSPSRVTEKFVGELVMVPDALGAFLNLAFESLLGDTPFISASSPWRDGLGTTVASPLVTLRSCPVGGEVVDASFWTADGFAAEDSPVIESGVLRDLGLTLYGSRKTGKPRSRAGMGALVMDPGTTDLAEMIAEVKHGLMLCNFAGMSASDNGDFSFVAKNSYLIRDGAVEDPVTETMVAGNCAALLRDVGGVTKERTDFGNAILPWVRAGGVTISGR